jgi:hypothetical protein
LANPMSITRETARRAHSELFRRAVKLGHRGATTRYDLRVAVNILLPEESGPSPIVFDLLSKSRMLFLRVIDLDGQEHYATDVGKLYDLVREDGMWGACAPHHKNPSALATPLLASLRWAKSSTIWSERAAVIALA